NSKIVMRGSDEEKKLAPDSLAKADLATAGDGLRMRAVNSRAASGVSSSPVDQASYYVEFFRPGTDESWGVFLLSQAQAVDPKTPPIHWQTPDRASVPTAATAATTHVEVSLRFKRSYKPYSLHLVDVRKDDYLGTDTARNYSSDVRLLDPQRNVDRDIRIWMNNPLRYAGETFYQSSFQPGFDGRDVTDLQLVTNTGWMVPYVACMYVAVGLLFHFSETLLRFLRRMENSPSAGTASSVLESATSRQQRRQEDRRKVDAQRPALGTRGRWLPGDWTGYDWCWVLVPLVLLVLWLSTAMSRPNFTHNDMDLDAFGRLPVAYQGRTQPLDTLARNAMLIISNRETVDIDANNKGLPAILWLADLASGKLDKEGERAADQYQIVRIENPDVAEILGLPRRERFRYAISECREKLEKFSEEVKKVRERDPLQLSTSERKVLELDNRLRTYMRLQFAFQPLPFPALPTREDLQTNQEEAMQRLQRIKELMERAPDYSRELLAMQPPLAVPNNDEDESAKDQRWQPYAVADYLAFVAPIFDKQPNPAAVHWNKILTSYANNQPQEFNRAVKDYQESQVLGEAAEFSSSRIRFEAFYNQFRPFSLALSMYLIIFVLSALSWLGYRRYLSRSALTVLAIVFLVHTFAICGRIYISGRPPVTNLYSSAVFIGWGSVLFCILLEAIYRLGVGTVVASLAGYSTLLIANGLAAEGDTFPVLVAVLDTQFWLSTHVTCITFGYATTLLAGLLGAVYLLLITVGRQLNPQLQNALPRMTYGILCFSIFFTFIGTVLGGLWADDSWGRFWGWDPKENGALMIVLWNALVLHARWGKMIGPRGLATLSVLGNIVVTWSWFGTNQLGIGLHAYGFQDGMVRNLWIFWATQFAISLLGLISYRRFAPPPLVTVDPPSHLVIPT
ncbi:MAG: cytochrome c biogenesis protein CcsA, partial [Planctomycetota bacterium]|nr:cytochrome c biogenesis protein CcsA [Planctomycetota bacterium]